MMQEGNESTESTYVSPLFKLKNYKREIIIVCIASYYLSAYLIHYHRDILGPYVALFIAVPFSWFSILLPIVIAFFKLVMVKRVWLGLLISVGIFGVAFFTTHEHILFPIDFSHFVYMSRSLSLLAAAVLCTRIALSVSIIPRIFVGCLAAILYLGLIPVLVFPLLLFFISTGDKYITEIPSPDEKHAVIVFEDPEFILSSNGYDDCNYSITTPGLFHRVKPFISSDCNMTETVKWLDNKHISYTGYYDNAQYYCNINHLKKRKDCSKITAPK